MVSGLEFSQPITSMTRIVKQTPINLFVLERTMETLQKPPLCRRRVRNSHMRKAILQ